MKKWFKQKEKPPVVNEPCKNCGNVFSGHYCPECGQSVHELNRPFSIIFYDFVGNLFSIDTRFLNTFPNLVFRPGFLTKQFFAGRRVRYAPPIRFFIFVSFILFLLLQIFSNRALNKYMYKDLYDEGGPVYLDSASVQLADSVLGDTRKKISQELEANSVSLDSLGSVDIEANIDSIRNYNSIDKIISKLVSNLEKKLEKETDPEKRAKIINQLNLARSPQTAISKILKYMSWAFFILLPVFALILKLFYIRRKQFYIRHLIFSIHFHSFVYIIFIVITLLYMLLKAVPGSVTLFLLFTIPVYFIIALKKFYGQSIFKVFIKFLGISLFYNTIFWVITGLVFVNALSFV